MSEYVLALDQGTTSSRAILFGRDGRVVAQAQQEFPQILPSPGHVEHDPEAIWSSQLAVARAVMEKAQAEPSQIATVGIANQRETTVLWERETGKPVGNAIVWQSRISAGVCQRLKSAGLEEEFRNKTGLLLDPYFSGTKITYLLERDSQLRERAERGEILFGTVDSYLIWKLTGGRRHVTDVSNASRTLLFNVFELDWDDELLKHLGVPRAMLPEVLPSSGEFGEIEEQWLGKTLPLTGVAGDQQAATFGQACFDVGSAKSTYGTGSFLLMNIGDKPVLSDNHLLLTVGWSLQGKVTYCLEGSVFVAGAVVQWLRDGLGLIERSEDVEALAATAPHSEGVYLVPAFVGLGAPHWDPYARGAVFGLTRGTTGGHLARAALESMAFQTCDLLHAMRRDAQLELGELKVDGGAAVNDELMQFQADMVGATVRRPVVSETTALGAAYLAGLAVGFWENQQDVVDNWALDREFKAGMADDERQERYRGWQKAVERSKAWQEAE